MFIRNILLTAICLLFPASALAGHLDLAWHPNSEPDLAGYKIYYGTSSGDYSNWIAVGRATSFRITGLSDDTEYFLALTAYDTSGNESDFSGEVSAYALPGEDPVSPVSGGSSSSDGGCFITTVSQLLQDY